MTYIQSNREMALAMDEAVFKTAYIANFMATYMAVNYDRHCMEGHKGEPYKHQPYEDARFNANCAWDTIQEFK